MKRLSHFVVKVQTQPELNVAVNFFRRASRRKLNFFSDNTFRNFTTYVGMHESRTVMASGTTYPHETIVPYSAMDSLADSPSRVAALKASGWVKPTGDVKPKTRDVVVKFNYPTKPGHRHYPLKTVRNVRLVKADDKYYMGVEILPDNKFQFKKFLKTKASNVEVLTF